MKAKILITSMMIVMFNLTIYAQDILIPARIDSAWGFINETGKWIIEPKYKYVSGFAKNGLARVEVDHKCGFIDKSGKFVIAPTIENNNMGSFNDYGLSTLIVNSKCGLVDVKGNIILDPKFDRPSERFIYNNDARSLPSKFFNFDVNGLAKVKKEGKYGFIDTAGNIILEPQFDEIMDFDANGLARVKDGGKYGLIDKTGKILFKPIFDEVGDFASNGLAPAKVMEEKIIDNKDDVFIDDDIESTHSVDLWGVIDKSGRWIVEPKYQKVYNFTNGIAMMRNDNGKYGFIDSNGNAIVEAKFDYAWDFESAGLARIVVDGKRGLIDATGNYVVEPQYDQIMAFDTTGHTLINKDDKIGFIDTKGKVIVQPQFEHCFSFSYDRKQSGILLGLPFKDEDRSPVVYFDKSGWARVTTNGKVGCIDKTGKFVIEPKYDGILWFSDGMLVVEEDGKFGYLDATGKITITPQFEYAEPFDARERALVTLNGKFGIIDKKGNFIIQPKFDITNSIYVDQNDIMEMQLDGKPVFVHPTGKTFENIRTYQGIVFAMQNHKWGIIDTEGNWIAEPKYNEIGEY